MVHNHLVNGKLFIALNYSQTLPCLKRNKQYHKHVESYQEVPNSVVQLHNISRHEKCAMSKIGTPQYFSSPGCLLRIEKEPQSSPALQYTLKVKT